MQRYAAPCKDLGTGNVFHSLTCFSSEVCLEVQQCPPLFISCLPHQSQNLDTLVIITIQWVSLKLLRFIEKIRFRRRSLPRKASSWAWWRRRSVNSFDRRPRAWRSRPLIRQSLQPLGISGIRITSWTKIRGRVATDRNPSSDWTWKRIFLVVTIKDHVQY